MTSSHIVVASIVAVAAAGIVWNAVHRIRGMFNRRCWKCGFVWVVRDYEIVMVSWHHGITTTNAHCLSCGSNQTLRPWHERYFSAWSYAWRIVFYRGQFRRPLGENPGVCQEYYEKPRTTLFIMRMGAVYRKKRGTAAHLDRLQTPPVVGRHR